MDLKARIGLLVGALVILWAPLLADRSITYQHGNVAVKYAGFVPVSGDMQGLIPEDVGREGRLLLLGVPKRATPDDPLLVFDTGKDRLLLPPITVRWPELAGATANNNCVRPVLRFLDSAGNRVAGLYGCFIVVVDLHKGTVKWSTRIPEIHHKYSLKDSTRSFATALLAVDKRGQKFAVLVNNETMKEPEVFLYNGGSSAPLLHWQLPRLVQSAAWSPDGEKLAVLYSGFCDSHLNYYQVNIGRKRRNLLTLPDVAVFDARTGHLDLSFFSGQPEAQIAYSPDGELIYTIAGSDAAFVPRHARSVICAFSAADGKPVRTIHVSPTGVRSRFALSPDGELIAADATTTPIWVWHDPSPIAVRFVLLNVATGKKVFEHEETWGGGDANATTLMFSPDGRVLIADPLATDGEGPVEIYRLVGTP